MIGTSLHLETRHWKLTDMTDRPRPRPALFPLPQGPSPPRCALLVRLPPPRKPSRPTMPQKIIRLAVQETSHAMAYHGSDTDIPLHCAEFCKDRWAGISRTARELVLEKLLPGDV